MSGKEGFKTEFASYKDGQQKYLRINLSDLKIHLRDFKAANKSSDISGLMIGVIGVWVPLFTSDFKAFWGMSSDNVKGIYICVAILLSSVLLKRVIFHWSAVIYARFKKRNLTKYQTDPDKLVDELYRAVPDETLDKI